MLVNAKSLPEKHFARTNPDHVVERRKMVFGEVPILTTIVNRTEFLLYGEDPVVKSGGGNGGENTPAYLLQRNRKGNMSFGYSLFSRLLAGSLLYLTPSISWYF